MMARGTTEEGESCSREAGQSQKLGIVVGKGSGGKHAALFARENWR